MRTACLKQADILTSLKKWLSGFPKQANGIFKKGFFGPDTFSEHSRNGPKTNPNPDVTLSTMKKQSTRLSGKYKTQVTGHCFTNTETTLTLA